MSGDRRLSRLLPLLFLLYAVPLAIALAWITPPFQNPDAESHFLRAVQIAGGELVGTRYGPGNAGGRVDPAASVAAAPFRATAGHPDILSDPNALITTATVRWGQPPQDVTFANNIACIAVAAPKEIGSQSTAPRITSSAVFGVRCRHFRNTHAMPLSNEVCTARSNA